MKRNSSLEPYDIPIDAQNHQGETGIESLTKGSTKKMKSIHFLFHKYNYCLFQAKKKKKRKIKTQEFYFN